MKATYAKSVHAKSAPDMRTDSSLEDQKKGVRTTLKRYGWWHAPRVLRTPASQNPNDILKVAHRATFLCFRLSETQFSTEKFFEPASKSHERMHVDLRVPRLALDLEFAIRLIFPWRWHPQHYSKREWPGIFVLMMMRPPWKNLRNNAHTHTYAETMEHTYTPKHKDTEKELTPCSGHLCAPRLPSYTSRRTKDIGIQTAHVLDGICALTHKPKT